MANLSCYGNQPAVFPQIELVMQMFIKSLAEQATARAFEEKSATIRGHHVRAVSKVSVSTDMTDWLTKDSLSYLCLSVFLTNWLNSRRSA